MAALTDSATTVNDLKSRVLAFVRERDWEQFHSPKNLSMALAAESGFADVTQADSATDAVAALAGRRPAPGRLLICGSLYLAGWVLRENG